MMDTRTYFNFPDPEPEPEFETFEQWAWRLVHEERAALESVRESLRPAAKTAAPETPVIPDGVPVNESVREAWRLYHSSPRSRRARESPVHAGRRPRVRELHTLIADQRLDHLLPG